MLNTVLYVSHVTHNKEYKKRNISVFIKAYTARHDEDK